MECRNSVTAYPPTEEAQGQPHNLHLCESFMWKQTVTVCSHPHFAHYREGTETEGFKNPLRH